MDASCISYFLDGYFKQVVELPTCLIPNSKSLDKDSFEIMHF